MDNNQYDELLIKHNIRPNVFKHPSEVKRYKCKECDTFMTNTGKIDHKAGLDLYIIYVCGKCEYETSIGQG